MAGTIPIKAFTSFTVTSSNPIKMSVERHSSKSYLVMLVTRYAQIVLVRTRKRYCSGGAMVAIAIFGPDVTQNGKLVETVGKIPMERDGEEGKGLRGREGKRVTIVMVVIIVMFSKDFT